MTESRSLQIILLLFIFPSIPLIAGTSSMSPSQPETALEGTISISPVHGGPARPGVPDSRPLALAKFVVRRGDQVVASFVTDAQGRFHVVLPPGHYAIALEKSKGRMGHYGPFKADVVTGQVTHVSWQCDTGIR